MAHITNLANPIQTRPLYEESRHTLCDKIAANIQSTGSICRQVVKGSKSSDILTSAARNFASFDAQLSSTESNLKKIGITIRHFDEQLDTINRMVDDNIPKSF